ncbi:hypothetical protein [Paenibacillus sp.]|uniref:hypothetical protein n=1 Tax=Paenibacillus sp. TaxID=58172 RepID=UPI002D3C410C|nr:hypothetical protein [Paenibacillus sp.]HZG85175.1 hypothetical protein [Paenibacillus sp.]
MSTTAAFETEYKSWLVSFAAAGAGGRRPTRAERLFARRVWWPAFRSFERLRPGERAGDERAGRFEYAREPFAIAVEIDGGDPAKEANAASRPARPPETTGAAPTIRVAVRFSYGDVRDAPERCREALAALFARLYPESIASDGLAPCEREIARLAQQAPRPITPADVSRLLRVCDKTARKKLKALVAKRVLRPAGRGAGRIRAYKPAEARATLR